VEIAKCSNCGTEIDLDDLASDQLRLILAVGALIGTTAVQGVFLSLPQYEAAVDGFEARVKEITETVHQTVDDLAEWGDAYDE